MSDLTPLTPGDCDLRGLEWMPLYGDRLFASNTWLMAGPEARCAAMMLWWESWKQCPAGSLPDHDRALAQLAGYGMSLKAWLLVKAEAMPGWLKCSDGRLYHPVVCEFAREAWERRVKERERKAAYRAKKDGTNGNVPPDSNGTNAGQEPGHERDQDGDGHVEKKEQDRTGQDRTFKKERKKDSPPAPPTGARHTKKPIAQDWWPSADGVAYAHQRGVDLAAQVPIFVRHHVATDSRKVDFSPLWLTWCDRDQTAVPPSPSDPDAIAKRVAVVEGWFAKLRIRHGTALNGTTMADLDRISRKFAGPDFTKFLDAISYGHAWLLDELHAAPA